MWAVLAMNPQSALSEVVLVDLHDTEDNARSAADDLTMGMNPGYTPPVDGDPATDKDWDALVKDDKPRAWVQNADLDRDMIYRLLGLERGLVPLTPGDYTNPPKDI
jgi:hypothetical protein